MAPVCPSAACSRFSQEDEAVCNEGARCALQNSSALSSGGKRMTMQLRPLRPASQHVSDRDNIVLKAVVHELALAIDEPLISTAHAAGTDRQALRLAESLRLAP